MASAALYFHLARLIRKESGASGKTSHVGTYASDRSSSDRFYRSLGFQLKEQISPVGIETLSSALGEEAETLEEVYEPFLIQEGFIQKTSRGRMLTNYSKQLSLI